MTRRGCLAAATSLGATLLGCSDAPEPQGDGPGRRDIRPPPLASPPEPEPLSFEACPDERVSGIPSRCTITDDGGEGPYYTPGAPDKDSLLEPGVDGIPLIVTGRCLSYACEPLAGAALDLWQADPFGDYDSEGFRLRGVLHAGANGFYRLETILPGHYGARPAHIHVKIRASGLAEITTQIYFAGDPRLTPAIAESGLVMPTCERRDGALHAAFDFVLPPPLMRG